MKITVTNKSLVSMTFDAIGVGRCNQESQRKIGRRIRPSRSFQLDEALSCKVVRRIDRVLIIL